MSLLLSASEAIPLLLTLLLGLCVQKTASMPIGSNRVRTAELWLWGCYSGGPYSNCSVVPDDVWPLLSAGKPALTGIFPGFGHELGSDGYTISIPGGSAALAMSLTVQRIHALGGTVKPIINLGGGSSTPYKSFVRNQTARASFITAFTADAKERGYDGFNFDWEFGDFNSTDEASHQMILTLILDQGPPTELITHLCRG